MSSESVHVFYNNPGWAVTVDGERVPRTLYQKEEDACHAGRALAKRMHCDLVLHDADGTVAEREEHSVTIA